MFAKKIYEQENLGLIEKSVASVNEIFRLQCEDELRLAEEKYLPKQDTSETVPPPSNIPPPIKIKQVVQNNNNNNNNIVNNAEGGEIRNGEIRNGIGKTMVQ